MLFRLAPLLLFCAAALYPLALRPSITNLVLMALGLLSTGIGVRYPVFPWYALGGVILLIQYLALTIGSAPLLVVGLTALLGGLAAFLVLEVGFFATLIPIEQEEPPRSASPWTFRQIRRSIAIRMVLSLLLGILLLAVTVLAERPALSGNVFFVLLALASFALIACFLALRPEKPSS